MGKRGSDTAGQSPATAKKPALGDEDWPVKARTSVANLLKEVPEAQLAKTLDALAEAVEGGRTRLKRLGGDQELEALVKVARSWVKAATSEESLRALLMQVKVTKAATNFDEESSDMRSNTVGATFDITFNVGPHEGLVCGSAVNGEGVNYTGQIEGNFLGMYEDNLLVPHDWPRDLKEELEEDADKWRATAGLTPNDISWGDTIRAVAGAVFHLAAKSQYNDDDWVLEFVTRRHKQELQRAD